MRGKVAIRSILLHQLASLQQLDLHRCPASTDFKLHLRHLVWELLCCTMSKKSSTTQSSLSSSWTSTCHAHLAGHHLLYPIIVNFYLEQLIDIIFNINMGIHDVAGILFKEAIFAVGASSAEVAIISFPLVIAFVL